MENRMRKIIIPKGEIHNPGGINVIEIPSRLSKVTNLIARLRGKRLVAEALPDWEDDLSTSPEVRNIFVASPLSCSKGAQQSEISAAEDALDLLSYSGQSFNQSSLMGGGQGLQRWGNFGGGLNNVTTSRYSSPSRDYSESGMCPTAGHQGGGIAHRSGPIGSQTPDISFQGNKTFPPFARPQYQGKEQRAAKSPGGLRRDMGVCFLDRSSELENVSGRGPSTFTDTEYSSGSYRPFASSLIGSNTDSWRASPPPSFRSGINLSPIQGQKTVIMCSNKPITSTPININVERKTMDGNSGNESFIKVRSNVQVDDSLLAKVTGDSTMSDGINVGNYSDFFPEGQGTMMSDIYEPTSMLHSSDDMDSADFGKVMGGHYNVLKPMTPSLVKSNASPHSCQSAEPEKFSFEYSQSFRPSMLSGAQPGSSFDYNRTLQQETFGGVAASRCTPQFNKSFPQMGPRPYHQRQSPSRNLTRPTSPALGMTNRNGTFNQSRSQGFPANGTFAKSPVGCGAGAVNATYEKSRSMDYPPNGTFARSPTGCGVGAGNATYEKSRSMGPPPNGTFAKSPTGCGVGAGNATYEKSRSMGPPPNGTFAKSPTGCGGGGNSTMSGGIDVGNYSDFFPEGQGTMMSDIYEPTSMLHSSDDMDSADFGKVMGGHFNVLKPMTPSPVKSHASPQSCHSGGPEKFSFEYSQSFRPSMLSGPRQGSSFDYNRSLQQETFAGVAAQRGSPQFNKSFPQMGPRPYHQRQTPSANRTRPKSPSGYGSCGGGGNATFDKTRSMGSPVNATFNTSRRGFARAAGNATFAQPRALSPLGNATFARSRSPSPYRTRGAASGTFSNQGTMNSTGIREQSTVADECVCDDDDDGGVSVVSYQSSLHEHVYES